MMVLAGPALAVDISIDGPIDLAFALGMLAIAVGAYYVLERIQPGYGSLPPAFGAALKHLDQNGAGARVLCWWDYAAPLADYTDTVPVLRGPSTAIEPYVDDAERVRTWADDAEVRRVADFFLAPSAEAALASVPAETFDYVLVARSDLLKAPVMREAADRAIEEPDEVFIRQLLRGDVDWPLAFENEQVRLYRAPRAE